VARTQIDSREFQERYDDHRDPQARISYLREVLVQCGQDYFGADLRPVSDAYVEQFAHGLVVHADCSPESFHHAAVRAAEAVSDEAGDWGLADGVEKWTCRAA
jgi:hypothetical protein